MLMEMFWSGWKSIYCNIARFCTVKFHAYVSQVSTFYYMNCKSEFECLVIA